MSEISTSAQIGTGGVIGSGGVIGPVNPGEIISHSTRAVTAQNAATIFFMSPEDSIPEDKCLTGKEVADSLGSAPCVLSYPWNTHDGSVGVQKTTYMDPSVGIVQNELTILRTDWTISSAEALFDLYEAVDSNPLLKISGCPLGLGGNLRKQCRYRICSYRGDPEEEDNRSYDITKSVGPDSSGVIPYGLNPLFLQYDGQRVTDLNIVLQLQVRDMTSVTRPVIYEYKDLVHFYFQGTCDVPNRNTQPGIRFGTVGFKFENRWSGVSSFTGFSFSNFFLRTNTNIMIPSSSGVSVNCQTQTSASTITGSYQLAYTKLQSSSAQLTEFSLAYPTFWESGSETDSFDCELQMQTCSIILKDNKTGATKHSCACTLNSSNPGPYVYRLNVPFTLDLYTTYTVNIDFVIS